MRILMLTTNSSLMDGINRHILNIAPPLNNFNGVTVAVCTVMPWSDLNEALSRQDIKTYSLGYGNGHAIGIFRAFHRVIKDFKPTIIHSHVMAIMERVYLSYLGKKIPLVETIHGLSDVSGPMSLRSKLERLITSISPLKWMGRIYISQGIMHAMSPYLSRVSLSKVCYNPIDFDSVSTHTCDLRKELNVHESTKLIGTACRISEVKNPQAFTHIMCRVLKQTEKVHAVVIGEGDANITETCKEIVQQAGMQHRFHWLGYRNDAPQLVGQLNCFVMTSISEGLPTSLLECFVSHTPVAMLEGQGGLKDIISLNNEDFPIILYSHPENYNDLVNKIVNLLNDHSLATKLTNNAYTIGKENFGISHVICNMIKLYYQAKSAKQ